MLKLILRMGRNGLGYIVLAISQLTLPRKMSRDPEVQQNVDAATSHMQLYQFHVCPFCIRTRRNLHRLNLDIEKRDISDNGRNLENRKRLLEGGGMIKAPCLHIEEEGESRWIYESLEIVQYLEERFADQNEPESKKCLN